MRSGAAVPQPRPAESYGTPAQQQQPAPPSGAPGRSGVWKGGRRAGSHCCHGHAAAMAPPKTAAELAFAKKYEQLQKKKAGRDKGRGRWRPAMACHRRGPRLGRQRPQRPPRTPIMQRLQEQAAAGGGAAPGGSVVGLADDGHAASAAMAQERAQPVWFLIRQAHTRGRCANLATSFRPPHSLQARRRRRRQRPLLRWRLPHRWSAPRSGSGGSEKQSGGL